MNYQNASYVEIMNRRLKEIHSAGAPIKIRAWARKFNIDPSALSRFLTGKKILPLEAAGRIVEQLNLDANDQKQFYESLISLRLQNSVRKMIEENAKHLESQDTLKKMISEILPKIV